MTMLLRVRRDLAGAPWEMTIWNSDKSFYKIYVADTWDQVSKVLIQADRERLQKGLPL